MTTTTDMPPVGSRVVVRYRLPAGSPQPMTDAIGVLTAVDYGAVTVETERAGTVRIPTDLVVALKALAPRPVRNSEIRALEHAAALGWPGTEQEWIGGWWVRAGHGVTRRANSAIPLEPDAGDEHLPEIVAWYSARGLAPRLALPDRLFRTPAGWTVSDDVLVLTCTLHTPAAPIPTSRTHVARRGRVRTDSMGAAAESAAPDDRWLALHPSYRSPDASSVLTAVDGVAAFLRLGDVSAARAAVTTASGVRWVGLTAVTTDPDHRGRGLGEQICADAIAWGAKQGATRAYVQVEETNHPARRLYERLGFVLHHRYRYAEPVTPLD